MFFFFFFRASGLRLRVLKDFWVQGAMDLGFRGRGAEGNLGRFSEKGEPPEILGCP